MWMSRNEVTEANEKYSSLQAKYKELKTEQDALLPYPDAYQQRLEYWKERAGEELRPTLHLLYVSGQWFSRREEFHDLDSMQARHQQLREQLEAGVGAVLFDGKTITPPLTLEEVKGHLSPYTPAEIESWAKERLEGEMKRWKVVLPDPSGFIITGSTSQSLFGSVTATTSFSPSGWPFGGLK